MTPEVCTENTVQLYIQSCVAFFWILILRGLEAADGIWSNFVYLHVAKGFSPHSVRVELCDRHKATIMVADQAEIQVFFQSMARL